MAYHVSQGDDVHILIMSPGVASREPSQSDNAEAERLAAANQAAEALGAHAPIVLNFPDNRLDTIDRLELTKSIERVVRDVSPAIVYTHHAGDLNVDHAMVNGATVTACRPLPDSSVRAIHTFETPSSTEYAVPTAANAFLPTRFVDITDFIETKICALDAYASEMRAVPHPRSVDGVRALATTRGVRIGVSAAEAFMTVFEAVANK